VNVVLNDLVSLNGDGTIENDLPTIKLVFVCENFVALLVLSVLNAYYFVMFRKPFAKKSAKYATNHLDLI